MVYKHFNSIKPVSVIKFPTTKQGHSKKFAFVYFKSLEDANEVKAAIERDRDAEEKAIKEGASAAELSKLGKKHKIVKKAIKVSPLAVNESSKLMLKPKLAKTGDSKAELKQL